MTVRAAGRSFFVPPAGERPGARIVVARRGCQFTTVTGVPSGAWAQKILTIFSGMRMQP